VNVESFAIHHRVEDRVFTLRYRNEWSIRASSRTYRFDRSHPLKIDATR
jgi:hypothetical protein